MNGTLCGLEGVPEAQLKTRQDVWKREHSKARGFALVAGMVLALTAWAYNRLTIEGGGGLEVPGIWGAIFWCVACFVISGTTQAVSMTFWKMANPRPVSIEDYNHEFRVRATLDEKRKAHPWWNPRVG